MLRSLSSRLVLTLLVATFALPVVTWAQSQDSESVAEAARRAREQKKNAPKSVRVVTEDDIPARPPQPEAQPAAAQPAAGQPAGAAGDTSGAEAKKDKKGKEAELAALKEVVEKAEKAADLAKRDLALDQDTYLSNPDYEHDTAGKAKLDELRQQYADKRLSLEDAKTKLAAYLQSNPTIDAPPDNSDKQAPPAAPAPQ